MPITGAWGGIGGAGGGSFARREDSWRTKRD